MVSTPTFMPVGVAEDLLEQPGQFIYGFIYNTSQHHRQHQHNINNERCCLARVCCTEVGCDKTQACISSTMSLIFQNNLMKYGFTYVQQTFVRTYGENTEIIQIIRDM